MTEDYFTFLTNSKRLFNRRGSKDSNGSTSDDEKNISATTLNVNAAEFIPKIASATEDEHPVNPSSATTKKQKYKKLSRLEL